MVLIQIEIYVRAFDKTTTIHYLQLIQQLCDGTGVIPILQVDHKIEVMHKKNISLIKDLVNLILAQRVQPSPTAILVYLNGPLILAEPVEGKNTGADIEIESRELSQKLIRYGGGYDHFYINPDFYFLVDWGIYFSPSPNSYWFDQSSM